MGWPSTKIGEKPVFPSIYLSHENETPNLVSSSAKNTGDKYCDCLIIELNVFRIVLLKI